MRVIHLKDTMSYYCSDEEDFVWLISSYEIGDYCGSGEAAALSKDGYVYTYNLSHCSCYGPIDGDLKTAYTGKYLLEEFLGNTGDVLVESISSEIIALARVL